MALDPPHRRLADGHCHGWSIHCPAFCPVQTAAHQHAVAGFKFATVGVLYAVLLAFAMIVVWGKFNVAENAVAKEAGAARQSIVLRMDLTTAPHRLAWRHERRSQRRDQQGLAGHEIRGRRIPASPPR